MYTKVGMEVVVSKSKKEWKVYEFGDSKTTQVYRCRDLQKQYIKYGTRSQILIWSAATYVNF